MRALQRQSKFSLKKREKSSFTNEQACKEGGRTVGETVETERLGDALRGVEQERREDSIVDRVERNVVESEEQRSSDDVGLGGEERDVERRKVAGASSTNISRRYVAGDNRSLCGGDIDLRIAVSVVAQSEKRGRERTGKANGSWNLATVLSVENEGE